MDILTNEHNEVDTDKDMSQDSTFPWSATLEEAKKYEFGLDGYEQDDTEAIRLYKEAADQGCLMAYSFIEDVAIDADNIVITEYSKEGAARGNYLCYDTLLTFFAEENDFDNFHQCMRSFIRDKSDPEMERRLLIETDETINYENKIVKTFWNYLAWISVSKTEAPPEFIPAMIPYKTEITAMIDEDLAKSGKFYQELRGRYLESKLWVMRNLHEFTLPHAFAEYIQQCFAYDLLPANKYFPEIKQNKESILEHITRRLNEDPTQNALWLKTQKWVLDASSLETDIPFTRLSCAVGTLLSFLATILGIGLLEGAYQMHAKINTHIISWVKSGGILLAGIGAIYTIRMLHLMIFLPQAGVQETQDDNSNKTLAESWKEETENPVDHSEKFTPIEIISYVAGAVVIIILVVYYDFF